ncbi:hypothetical protein VCRA2117O328_10242 [Vibrio crassostreae]|nr:hypothetical protein VCRA2117O328_10242 [Vibrio crassostreae]
MLREDIGFSWLVMTNRNKKVDRQILIKEVFSHFDKKISQYRKQLKCITDDSIKTKCIAENEMYKRKINVQHTYIELVLPESESNQNLEAIAKQFLIRFVINTNERISSYKSEHNKSFIEYDSMINHTSIYLKELNETSSIIFIISNVQNGKEIKFPSFYDFRYSFKQAYEKVLGETNNNRILKKEKL